MSLDASYLDLSWLQTHSELLAIKLSAVKHSFYHVITSKDPGMLFSWILPGYFLDA